MVSLFMEEGTVTIDKTWICHFELIECVPNKLGNCIIYPICILRFNFTGVQSKMTRLISVVLKHFDWPMI